MKRIGYTTLIILFLLAGSAFAFQAVTQADPAGIQATPTLGLTVTPVATVTSAASSTPLAGDEETTLIWEGDPLLDDNQAECRSLRLTADDQAMIGPCGAAGKPVDIFPGQPGGWADMRIRFAPFVTETTQSRVVFQGNGQITSPAWQRAITTWSQFTYSELASGRVSASVRTVLSWWLGEIPDQPGSCRQLVVLTHGYAYSNITPCAGGQVQESVGGWLDTAEWEKFDAWLYTYAPVYQENNYFTGQSTAEMSEAEVANLASWSEGVYTRLRHERAVANPTPGADCPEVTSP